MAPMTTTAKDDIEGESPKKLVDQSSDENEETANNPPMVHAAKVTVDEVGGGTADGGRLTVGGGGSSGDASAAAAAARSNSSSNNRSLLKIMIAVVIVIIIIIVVVTLTGRGVRIDDPYVPDYVDYTTGVSLVTYYGIDAVITSRLTRTVITVEVANGKDCSSIRGITFQLPHGARVASLATIANEQCIVQGQVKPLEDARDIFIEQAQQGLNTAYIEEANDSFTHNLQVAMPPLGITQVVVVLEQLLEQKLGSVAFAIPFAPNEQVDNIFLDVTVEDLVTVEDGGNTGGGPTFVLDLGPDITFTMDTDDEEAVATMVPTTVPTAGDNNVTAATGNRRILQQDVSVGNTLGKMTKRSSYTLHLPDAREYQHLPSIVYGSYTPADIPIQGLLTTDTSFTCFEHYFHPSSLEAMKRDIHFIIDTSESMGYYYQDVGNQGIESTKLYQTKEAIKRFIDDTLTPNDTLTIQTFARRGTEKLWGSAKMIDEEKRDAKNFLSNLVPTGHWNANIHEAYLEGLLRAKPSLVALDKNEEPMDKDDDTVTILVMISDTWSSNGGYGYESDRQVIAQDVYKLNAEGQVKIFSLGFADNADMELLDAIAIMNGGVAAPIYERSGGLGNITTQLTSFFDSEFGTVLLSDVEIIVDNNDGDSNSVQVHGETQSKFPLLADGYELVVRGLLGKKDDDKEGGNTPTALRAITKAATTNGLQEWTTTAVTMSDNNGDEGDEDGTTSLCFQSYAHARITQLLRLGEAAKFVKNDDLIAELVKLSEPCNNKKDINGNYNIAKCIEKEALNLALEAKVVVKGLTGMVTIDEDECLSFEEETEICTEGSSSNGWRNNDDYYYVDEGASDYGYDSGEPRPVYSGGGDGGNGESAATVGFKPADDADFSNYNGAPTAAAIEEDGRYGYESSSAGWNMFTHLLVLQSIILFWMLSIMN